ncbi:hypothetical protein EDD80_101380 [Anseongella ginsenosidimutans]|uniref:PH (Pleckstrin Homology) domain-containing protein n=1 Tax=Anseongella ginsenosidimutans TaxID=496056 RepID=A0A4R3KXP6_9SPHI|nr:hypothetical protein [Anseongella ginsenosidimutans]QEC51148.1 hypothetical protein FRZ59_01470 [Anseongella ginsenosidimutans]TCS90181.1 hypothetical protein EDD80_101380 [Anseongella ginsenosidimutans]
MEETFLFREKQYLGRNSYWISRRMVLAAFCFLVYFLEKEGRNAELLLIVGISITVISVLLLFIVHFKTSVYPDAIELDGFWSTRKVKIGFDSILKAEKIPYSRFMLNNPVYNLHKKGTIRFYTRGKEAVKLTDKDGLEYIIGSQLAAELLAAVKKAMATAR